VVLGNFMLLNLFLAILLKSIQSIGEKENQDVDSDEKTEKKKDEEGNEQEEENQEEEEQSHACSHGDESMALNSSNSNIEEEFEHIKN
jgi:Na+-transporting methylmalonyl-CoA/oxaloacetate decarboxylase gamma subunit